ncbi:MAG: ROK family protein [Thermoplasmata archaeon]
MTGERPSLRASRAKSRGDPGRARSAYFGIDLGGTKVAVALVDEGGRVVAQGRQLIHHGAASLVLDDILACLTSVGVPRGYRPRGAGVGVAGQVRRSDGMVLYAPNLKWRNYPLGHRLRAALRLPVVVTNDVQAETYGEWHRGAGRAANDLLCVFIGTGVGGGVVTDGRLLSGAAHAFGEVGHSMLVAGGRRCHCPASGCIEAYVSGWAIAVRAQEAVRRTPELGDDLVRRAGSVEAIAADTVTEASREGDPLARQISEETAQFLGLGLAGLVNAFNPSRLVLGGGIIDHHPEYVPVVRRLVRRLAQPPAARAVRVVRSALGPDAGVIGSALLARDRKAERHP